jgi:AraC family transcriptional regulator
MKIHLFEGFAILFANKLNTEWHSHQALQITLSSDRKELKCETELGTIVGEGILIPPLVSHKFSLGTQDIALVLIDDETSVAEFFKNRQVSSIDTRDISIFKEDIQGVVESGSGHLFLRKIAERTKILKIHTPSALDVRIQELVNDIKCNRDFLPSAVEAAGICGISESRFMHLFKEEIGIPFRKYLSWIKLKRALELIQSGSNITEAAHYGGFSDSAHFSRFFTSQFGINPSEVFKHSRFIQS